MKYVPKIWASIGFILLVWSAIFLYIQRKSAAFPFHHLRQLLPDYPLHISNFSISYALYTTVGFMWLQMGSSFKYITYLGIAIVITNFIYELWIPFINTPDITDAVYGVIGSILGHLFLFYLKKYGMKEKI
nr:hypothetical protein [uncultured Undibacterium sp.]